MNNEAVVLDLNTTDLLFKIFKNAFDSYEVWRLTWGLGNRYKIAILTNPETKSEHGSHKWLIAQFKLGDDLNGIDNKRVFFELHVILPITLHSAFLHIFLFKIFNGFQLPKIINCKTKKFLEVGLMLVSSANENMNVQGNRI